MLADLSFCWLIVSLLVLWADVLHGLLDSLECSLHGQHWGARVGCALVLGLQMLSFFVGVHSVLSFQSLRVGRVWGHADDLGVVQGFAGWAVALCCKIDATDFAHVGADDDVGVLGIFLSSLLSGRVLSLSTWEWGIDSDLACSCRWHALESLLANIRSLRLRVIARPVRAIGWFLIRWSQNCHALCSDLHASVVVVIIDLLLRLRLRIDLASQLLSNNALSHRDVQILLIWSID